MKVRTRKSIPTILLEAGDSITLSYKEEVNGEVVRDEVVLQEDIGRVIEVNEAIIFDVGPSDFDGVTDGIGGAFVHKEKK